MLSTALCFERGQRIGRLQVSRGRTTMCTTKWILRQQSSLQPVFTDVGQADELCTSALILRMIKDVIMRDEVRLARLSRILAVHFFANTTDLAGPARNSRRCLWLLRHGRNELNYVSSLVSPTSRSFKICFGKAHFSMTPFTDTINCF